MLCRYCVWALGVAAGVWMAVGCAPANRHPTSAPARTPALRDPADRNGARAAKLVEAHAHYGAGVIHDMNDEPGPALKEYYQAAILDPDDEALILEVSRRFLQRKELEKALDVLTRAAARPRASGTIYARLGMVCSQLGKTDQALAANRTAIKKAPTSLTGYQNLFVDYLQAKQPAEALKVLDEAAQQPHTQMEFLLGLAELYANYGLQFPAQRDAAKAKGLAVLRKAETLPPATPLSRVRLADAFSQLGDSSRAAQLYLELLKRLPETSPVRDRVRAKLTELYLRGSDRKGAIEQLEAIVRDDPTNAQAYYYLATIAYEEKRWADAADYYGKTILLSPELEPPYYDLALTQLNLNKPGEALATLDTARKRFQQNFVAEFLSGLAFSRQKAYTEAIQHFTAAEVIARATEPKRLDENFYFQLGAACERKGDYAQSEKYFLKALEVAPDFAEAQNYLGYMWAERGTNLDQARALIEKAVKAEPKNAAFLDSLGWVLFKLNQPQEALGYVAKAVELNEEPDATLYDHLGDIQAALNRPDKAREAWVKSLSLEPNDQVKKKLEQATSK